MNVKLLRKVAKHILAEPKRLYMTSFIRTKKHSGSIGRPYAKCGTAGCIGGWACILELKVKDPHEFWQRHDVAGEARRLLELDYQQEYNLFEPSQWPKQFKRGTSDDGKKKTAQIAVARIEHFIKTKGKE